MQTKDQGTENTEKKGMETSAVPLSGLGVFITIFVRYFSQESRIYTPKFTKVKPFVHAYFFVQG